MTCIFTALNIGIVDFVVGTGTSPGTVNATDGKTYRYYAASVDGTQWEDGSGAWHNGTSTLQRTAINANSDDTLIPCNFATKPLVSVFPSTTGLLELAPVPPPPAGNLVGLTLSTAGGSSSFGVASGIATDNTHAVSMNLASAFTKTTAAWAAGTGNGALDTGSVAASTWYHVHLIDGAAVPSDVLISLSATAPTLPTGYTTLRRIGSVLTDVSSHWVAFVQVGDEILYLTNFQEISAAIPNTSAQTTTLTVPTGIKVRAQIHATLISGTSFIGVLITSPDETSVFALSLGGGNASLAASPGIGVAGDFVKRTNTSGQIQWQSPGTFTGAPTFSIYTFGYFDRRGRDD